MTADRRYPLKMRVLEAMLEAENNYVHPDQVQVAIDVIRAETLEEAARVVEHHAKTDTDNDTAYRDCMAAAAAIRDLKEKA